MRSNINLHSKSPPPSPPAALRTRVGSGQNTSFCQPPSFVLPKDTCNAAGRAPGYTQIFASHPVEKRISPTSIPRRRWSQKNCWRDISAPELEQTSTISTENTSISTENTSRQKIVQFGCICRRHFHLESKKMDARWFREASSSGVQEERAGSSTDVPG
jgi:hypothetical protein